MRVRKTFAALAVVAVGLAMVGSSGAALKPRSVHAAASKQKGGTVTWAEPPAATPNYIFPLSSPQYSTVNNIAQFQYLMFRPLYMFGSPQSTSPTLDLNLSLAAAPKFNSG